VTGSSGEEVGEDFFGFGQLVEPGEDGFAEFAVVEMAVELFADFGGEAGDFTDVGSHGSWELGVAVSGLGIFPTSVFIFLFLLPFYFI
jgi:hypothetical protein